VRHYNRLHAEPLLSCVERQNEISRYAKGAIYIAVFDAVEKVVSQLRLFHDIHHSYVERLSNVLSFARNCIALSALPCRIELFSTFARLNSAYTRISRQFPGALKPGGFIIAAKGIGLMAKKQEDFQVMDTFQRPRWKHGNPHLWVHCHGRAQCFVVMSDVERIGKHHELSLIQEVITYWLLL